MARNDFFSARNRVWDGAYKKYPIHYIKKHDLLHVCSGTGMETYYWLGLQS